MDDLIAKAETAPEPATSGGLGPLLTTLRPKLHRYCARMVGSGVDAEDVVQEALVKALEAFPEAPPIRSMEAWLFRVANNAALDFLRRRARQERSRRGEDMATIPDPIDEVDQRQAAASGLRTFMRLPVAERSAIILMDVLGYSLDEIGGITGTSIPSVKAALHRARGRLRRMIDEPDDRPPPALGRDERARLSAYVDRFNARDFDAIRNMLAEDVRLELVGKARVKGRAEVDRYFGNYASVRDWHLRLGLVDRRPALIARDPADLSRPGYTILLGWRGGLIATIRDFRHARYVMDAAEVIVLE
jgi:RNA polymerase sigma-70 factor (ECF subfamily)